MWLIRYWRSSLVHTFLSVNTFQVDMLSKRCPYTDEEGQCLGSEAFTDHLCYLPFSERLSRFKDEILKDFSDHQLLRARFRRFFHEAMPEAKQDGKEVFLVHQVPFITEIYGPRIIDLVIEQSEKEEKR